MVYNNKIQNYIKLSHEIKKQKMFEKYNSTSNPIKVNLRQHPKDSNAWNVHIVCKYMLATLVITLLFLPRHDSP
jgi:hypothetical protein